MKNPPHSDTKPDDFSFVAAESDAGTRLDALLALKIKGWSRSRLQNLIANEDILVNDQPAKSSYKVSENDRIEVELVVTPSAVFEPENIPLDVRFEDDYLAVINKPAGMVVHPGAGITGGTLANALAFHFGLSPSDLDFPADADEQSKIQNFKFKIGIVHRLDKDTSGLIVVAKSDDAHIALSEQFRERRVFKSYIALVHGVVENNTGTIDAPIARHKHNRLRMTIAKHGRSALSLWKVKKRFEKFTLLDVEIKTGRTHQIRVHLASINHPVVGDENYNAGRDNTIADRDIRKSVADLGRFFLHAERLEFTHPVSGEKMAFGQNLPPELNYFLSLLSPGYEMN